MTESYLAMELRGVDLAGRRVTGCCVPYTETSFLVPGPSGERIKRGAFARSLSTRGARGRIFLNLLHDDAKAVGRSDSFDDTADGLIGTFVIDPSELGDQTLSELDRGMWPYMSVAFRAEHVTRGDDGAVEVDAAYLAHVALVRSPAYEMAEVMVVRRADPRAALAGFGPRPDVDLSPVPRFWP